MAASVLIVDADAAFTTSAQRALEARGLRVFVHDDVSIELIRRLRPSAMMVNVELPKSPSAGFSICSRVRSDKLLRGTPILLTSALLSQEVLDQHAQSPNSASDYARKPLDASEAATRLSRLIVDHDTNATVQADEEPPPEVAPPPLPELAVEPWRTQKFDEALRDRGGEMEPPRANAVDKVGFLRQTVKYHESRERAAREAWELAQASGRELDRQNAAFRTELERRSADLLELKKTLIREAKSFETFNQEVTRILQDKNTVESELRRRLAQVEEERTALRQDLEVAGQQIDDDARRLKIFQDEIETLQAEHDSLGTALEDAEKTAAREESRVLELTLRLETTEAVVTERSREIESLHERLDQRTLEAEREQRRLEAALGEERRRLVREHEASVEVLRDEHAAEIAAYEGTLEEGAAAISSLEEEQRAAAARIDELEAAREGLQRTLDESEAARAILEDAARDAADRESSLEAELAAAAEAHELATEVMHAEHRVELDRFAEKLGERERELAREREALEAEHAETVAGLELERDRAQAALEEARAEHLAELAARDDRDAAREVEHASDLEAFEQLVAEAQTALDRAQRDGEAALRARDTEHAKALGAARAVSLEMEAERDGLKEDLEALRAEAAQQQTRAAELGAALEEERALREATAAERDGLEATRAALEDELDETRSAVLEHLAELDHLRAALEERGKKLAKLETDRAATKSRLDAAIARIDELEGQLEDADGRRKAMEQALEERDGELARRSAMIEELEARLQAAERDGESQKSKLAAAAAARAKQDTQAAELRARNAALEEQLLEASAERDAVRDELGASRDEGERAEAELARLAERNEALERAREADAAAHREAVAALEAELEARTAAASKDHEAQDREAHELRAKLGAKESELARLRSELGATKQKNELLEQGLAEHAEDLERAQESLTSAESKSRAEISRLARELERRSGDISALEAELDARAAALEDRRERERAARASLLGQVVATLRDAQSLLQSEPEIPQELSELTTQEVSAAGVDVPSPAEIDPALLVADGSAILQIEAVDDADIAEISSREEVAMAPGALDEPAPRRAERPFADLMAEIEAAAEEESDRARRPAKRRPVQPRRRDASKTALDSKARAVLEALDSGSLDGSPASADPFVRGQGLPVSERFLDDIKDDGQVTEVVHLDDLK